MECVEAALKSSFRKDTALKLSSQTFLEELSAFNVQNVVTSCDDFVVDDLLDFSHEEELFEEEPEQHHHGSVSEKQNETQEICNPSSFNDQFPSLPTSELSVPDDDAANLEWLSHFVEESFSEHTVSLPTGVSTESGGEKEAEPGSQVRPCFRTPVPAKARSKRTRTGVRVWPVVSPSFPELSSSTSSSTTTTTTETPCSPSLSSPSSPVFVCPAVSFERGWLPPEKKAKVRPATEALPPRRCSHCGVQKTPQWRTGPLGAKTLCNACGVRFKSGRLLPEYRPACSPTFSSQLHSNHHRKVLEMRRKKEEVMGEPVTGSGLPPVDPGF